MIRALIVDDEPLARRGVRQLLAHYPDVRVVGECRNGGEAIRALGTLEVDLVFLDIQMPGLDGFAVIRAHGPARMPLTVFVTAHDEFAVKAFDAHALDYLVKPIAEKRFHATMEKVRERVRGRDAVTLARRLAALLDNMESRGEAAPPRSTTEVPGSIAVPTATGVSMVSVAEIHWIRAEDYYSWIGTRSGELRIRESLAALEARLDPAHFMRIHRSAIVRLDQVKELREADTEREAEVILREGLRLPVSRRRVAKLKSLLRAPTRRS